MNLDIGPFYIYRSSDGTVDISLKCMANWACGWEWGYEDSIRGLDRPIISFRLGKLVIAYLSFFDGGCEVRFIGFWAFPTWGRSKNGRTI